jgi:glycosyltransferase involved in cell wall biosynthesis
MLLRIFSNFSKNSSIIGGNKTDTRYLINYSLRQGFDIIEVHIGVNSNQESIFDRFARRIDNILIFKKYSKDSVYEDVNIFFISGVYSYFEKVILGIFSGLKGKNIYLLRAGIFFEQFNTSFFYRFIFKCLTKKSYHFVVQGNRFNIFKSFNIYNTVKVLPNWTITDSFNVITKHKCFNDYPKCAFVGRFTEEKGLHDVIKLLNLFEKSQSRLDIIFLGDGILLSYLLSLKFNYINIKVDSFETKTQLKDFLHDVNYCFLPSKSEGLPNVLFEVWELGVIPIFSFVGSIEEYLIDDFNGLHWNQVENVYTKINQIQNNKNESLRILKNIEKFVNNNMSHKILKNLFEDL